MLHERVKFIDLHTTIKMSRESEIVDRTVVAQLSTPVSLSDQIGTAHIEPYFF